MKKLIITKFEASGKGSIATPLNKFIKDKKLSPSDISSIHFNSELTAAIIVYHGDENTKVITEEGNEE